MSSTPTVLPELDQLHDSIKIADHFKPRNYKDIKVSVRDDSRVLIEISEDDTHDSNSFFKTSLEFDEDESKWLTFTLIVGITKKQIDEPQPIDTVFFEHIYKCNAATRESVKAIQDKSELYDKVKSIFYDFMIAYSYRGLFDFSSIAFFDLYLKFNPTHADVLTLLKPTLLNIFSRKS